MVFMLLKHRHNFIAPMEWEGDLQRALGLTLDQGRFVCAFLACILAGLGIRLLRGATGEIVGAARPAWRGDGW